MQGAAEVVIKSVRRPDPSPIGHEVSAPPAETAFPQGGGAEAPDPRESVKPLPPGDSVARGEGLGRGPAPRRRRGCSAPRISNPLEIVAPATNLMQV